MNKADLIDKIAAGCHINKTQAAGAIDTTVDSITSALKKGDRVALIGFGTFSVSQKKSPQRAQPADRSHNQDCGPQSSKIFRRGRTQEGGQPQQVGPRFFW